MYQWKRDTCNFNYLPRDKGESCKTGENEPESTVVDRFRPNDVKANKVPRRVK